ncbi:type II secretion system secretin GspD [Pseudoxanthomonas winnipegensis]|uniref:Type II secretion system protein GspD n=1 Tax=Pseudoxanthomonas winnipegensis TaxID=2480810 RepID=A0A4Q8LPH8_9GAMM|nr:type II secretion system secretin GspD [Pseudoxanthomonas winnipegensis]RZZ89413.1 type II secretion system protein GspD [Pseudoxanthomonas winnipegensis]TAA33144.1 type II secretion system protein GspD [Pseudoxanthomonas winnipegensis]TBV78371.1 type II secretion system protein GspD [Pseudoxanthomonas winnipegensis]
MTSRFVLPLSLLLGLLAGCATAPVPNVQRQGNLANPGATAGAAQTSPMTSPEEPQTGPQAQIRRGTGQVINRSAAAAPPPALRGATGGGAMFNFEGESLQAVVKAILGDMLGQNYVIAPGVQGTVTLATPRAVSPAQALSLLEQVLGWNNARMVYSDGRYNIVPADQALAGTVAPRSGDAGNARGYEVRVVPLRFIAANEMKKILEPYARPNAVIATDPTRNLITLSGSRTELENYLRTVQIFDVDWLSGMSVGVFPLETGQASKVVADLEKVFGENSKTPSAGMFRFMPLEGANAVMVITPQAAYLDQIRDWLERIDNAGDTPRLFSYELKYIKARDLAQRLSEVFGGGSGRGGGSTSSLAPGAIGTSLTSSGMDGSGSTLQFGGNQDGSRSDDGSSGFGSSSGLGGSSGRSGSGSGDVSLNARQEGNGNVTLEVEGSKVGVAAVEETNSLLVRANGNAWRSIKDVIEKLDVMPMQVHIEAQVAEVALSGDLSYGVNWYFEQGGLLPDSNGGIVNNVWGRSITNTNGLTWTFLGNNAAAVLTALDKVTNLRLLQTPSVFVRNNAQAELKVGEQIPVNSYSVNTGLNSQTYSQVQYLDTGVILKVRPRVTKDGTVFMEIAQEVSSPGASPSNCDPSVSACNVPINTRFVKTEAAVQSGQTIMLAGLITDSVTDSSSGVPYLSRIPVLGALFGQKGQKTGRNEVIVLITPTIVRNPAEARNLTDEYSQKFRAMEPLHPPKGK